MNAAKGYWFPAKRRGWGWGLPIVWQGRTVLAFFFVLIGIGAFVVLPQYGDNAFVIYSAILCVALTIICWLKGEPPRWRWEKK